MSAGQHNTAGGERWLDLLAGEAAGDLAPAERAELAARRLASPAAGGGGDRDRDELMRTAALTQLAFLKRECATPEPLPPRLEARLMEQAAAWTAAAVGAAPAAMPRRALPPAPVGAAPAAIPRPALPPAPVGAAPAAIPAEHPPQPSVGAAQAAIPPPRTGWLVAAGLAAALLVTVNLGLDRATTPIDPASARQALLAEAADTVTLPWAPSEQPGYEAVRGDVVWSEVRQQGYLRLRGLPPNRPDEAQYQLWIVAPGRDVHPVDGGVFDVPAADEVVVPIDPKLAVDGAAAFAITLEQPGGVVVSDGPLLVVASAGS